MPRGYFARPLARLIVGRDLSAAFGYRERRAASDRDDFPPAFFLLHASQESPLQPSCVCIQKSLSCILPSSMPCSTPLTHNGGPGGLLFPSSFASVVSPVNGHVRKSLFSANLPTSSTMFRPPVAPLLAAASLSRRSCSFRSMKEEHSSIPFEARRWKDERKRFIISNRMRYRSSVAIAVPVCWVKKRDEIRDPVDGLVARAVCGPGRYNMRDWEAVMLRICNCCRDAVRLRYSVEM